MSTTDENEPWDYRTCEAGKLLKVPVPCPRCGEPETDVFTKWTYNVHKCSNCKTVFEMTTWGANAGHVEEVSEKEAEERVKQIEKRLHRLRDFRTSTDMVARRTYNDWLGELSLLNPSSAKEILNHLKKMEYKRDGEVWLGRAPEGWDQG